MPTGTLQTVLDSARQKLNDLGVVGGETFTNSNLQIDFAEAWRRVWRATAGNGSKRVQRIAYGNLPVGQTVFTPSTYNINDLGEPVLVEERQAGAAQTLASTSTATPIVVTFAAPHGLTGPGYGVIGGVANTYAPCGWWGFAVLSPTTISLSGSASDGIAGTGGVFTLNTTERWTEVVPADLAGQAIDGQPQAWLGSYLWINEQLQFRGALNIRQLRITYWSSGTAPTNAGLPLGLDDAVDLLATITAANAADRSGWYPAADRLYTRAFGSAQDPEVGGGMLSEYENLQVKSQQRGPAIRRLPFRQVRGRWGNWMLGN